MTPETSFTPLTALLGGGMIGLAATLLMLSLGRIAGISGILAGALSGRGAERHWRLAFLMGLLAPGAAIAILQQPVEISFVAGTPLLIAGGLLVGFGTRLGSGCTSGHGVCGLARLSPRSLVAVLTFMTAGFLTVGILRHVVGGL